MKTTVIRSTWMDGYGHRLDCQPYLGGALETKMLLEELPLRKDLVRDLVVDPDTGIYFAGREGVQWVESAEFGTPFLRGKDIRLADLSALPYISREQVKRNPSFLIREGMILITRSGTIGQTAYVRSDMDGMASSDPLRVVPHVNKVLPGYLYAFLSSKFGIPLVASGTYGAIIQHLEAKDIGTIPVPRFGDKIESEIHNLIEEASRLRTLASTRRREAITTLPRLCGLPKAQPFNTYKRPLLGSAMSRQLLQRMDGTYFIAPCAEARSAFDAAGERFGMKSLGDIAEVFIPTIFKRLYASDPEQGYPYITGADVFCIQPASDQYLMRKVAHENRLLLEYGMIVIQEAGQRYGLIGNSVMVGRTLSGFACTNNMVRLVPNDPDETGYIYTVLCSEYGIRLLKREAAGSSIPHLDASRVASIEIPWPDKPIRTKIAGLAHEARECWDRADELEKEADSILVTALTQTSK